MRDITSLYKVHYMHVGTPLARISRPLQLQIKPRGEISPNVAVKPGPSITQGALASGDGICINAQRYIHLSRRVPIQLVSRLTCYFGGSYPETWAHKAYHFLSGPETRCAIAFLVFQTVRRFFARYFLIDKYVRSDRMVNSFVPGSLG